MNIKSVSVTATKEPIRPRIRFTDKWLTQIGFTPGILIQVLPEPNGIIFQLYDEVIQNYGELFNDTQAKGGKLIQGCCEQLMTSGEYLRDMGLDVGDFCIALYDYGVIRVRKLPQQTKVIIPKKKDPKSRMICGNWLTGIGFVPEALIAVSAEPGKITLSLQNNDIESYAALVKHARANKMRLVQVMAKTDLICIAIPDISLNKAGFTLTEPLYVHYGYGVITLEKLDLEALGF